MKNINYILFISIIFILIAGVAFFLVRPLYQSFRRDKLQLKEIQTELKYRQNYIKRIDSIKKRLEKDKEARVKVDFSLPQNVSFSSLFNFLQAAAQKNGLVVSDVTIPKRVPLVLQKKVTDKKGRKVILKQKTNLDYYPFSVQVQGSYNNFEGFVSDLEKSARMIEIDNINFSVPIKLSTSSLFSYNLGLKVYSFHK